MGIACKKHTIRKHIAGLVNFFTCPTCSCLCCLGKVKHLYKNIVETQTAQIGTSSCMHMYLHVLVHVSGIWFLSAEYHGLCSQLISVCSAERLASLHEVNSTCIHRTLRNAVYAVYMYTCTCTVHTVCMHVHEERLGNIFREP